jgi:hypothetical protein
VAGPAAALTLRSHRRTLIPVIVAASLIWNGGHISMAFRPADRTAFARYYDSLVSYLGTVPRPWDPDRPGRGRTRGQLCG